jgi:hypothetical protein
MIVLGSNVGHFDSVLVRLNRRERSLVGMILSFRTVINEFVMHPFTKESQICDRTVEK